jgi:hypothetical protein
MGVDGNADPSGVAMGDIRFVHDRGVAGLLGSLPLAAPPVVRGDGGISCKCTRDGGIAGRSPTDAAGFANSFLQPRRAKTINQSINTSLKHARILLDSLNHCGERSGFFGFVGKTHPALQIHGICLQQHAISLANNPTHCCVALDNHVLVSHTESRPTDRHKKNSSSKT